jgi:hypothetical protein
MRILCVTSVRNEAPFLLEWIAHLRGAGVTDFLIYSNDCEDGTHEMLQTLHAAGIVEHVPQDLAEGESPQWTAFRAAWKHPLRKACDWALVCDVDEFINIHVGDHQFRDLIDAVPDETEGVVLQWRLFGNNGHIWQEDLPVTEQFTGCQPANAVFPVAATFFKSLIRTDGRFNQFGVHRPKQKSAEKVGLPVWVNGSGEVLPEPFTANPNRLSMYGFSNGCALVECNHYSLRSAESFLVKRARGLPNRSDKHIDLAYWVERNFNEERNTTISAMRPRTVAQLNDLSAIPGLMALHKAAVQWHRQKFLRLVEQEEELTLLRHIILASNSQNVPDRVARQIYGWYHALQANPKN